MGSICSTSHGNSDPIDSQINRLREQHNQDVNEKKKTEKTRDKELLEYLNNKLIPNIKTWLIKAKPDLETKKIRFSETYLKHYQYGVSFSPLNISDAKKVLAETFPKADVTVKYADRGYGYDSRILNLILVWSL